MAFNKGESDIGLDADSEAATAFPLQYIAWPLGLEQVTNVVIRLTAPLVARSDDNQGNIIIGGSKTAALNVDGAGGIETSQFPAKPDQFYNIRAMNDSTAVLPPVIDLIEFGTSPPLPPGYDLAVVLGPPILTSSDSLWFSMAFAVQGTSIRVYQYQNAALSRVLTNGSADARETILLTRETTGTLLVPPAPGVVAHLNIGFSTGSAGSADDLVRINASGTSIGGENQRISIGLVSSKMGYQNMDTLVSDAAEIQYLVTDGANNRVDILVSGYTMSMRS